MTARSQKLTGIWNEWLDTSSQLILMLHERNAASALERHDQIAKIEPKIAQKKKRLDTLQSKADSLLKSMAKKLNCEPNLDQVASAQESGQKQLLLSLRNKIIVSEREVDRLSQDKQGAL